VAFLPRVEPPPPEALRWAADSVGRGANVVGVRRLTGGTASAAHALRVELPSGRRTSLVMRRFLRADPLRPGAVGIEARVLGALEPTPIPAPRLVAVDESGESAGAPALLMHKIVGRIELGPERVPDYIEQMGRMAASIHDGLDIEVPDAIGPSAGGPNRRDKDTSWSHEPALWRRVAEVLSVGPPPAETRFVHGDFQHFNLLWSGGRLRGVVDWSLAQRGVPSRDLAHCRLNLAALHGPAPAERLREVWEAETGWQLDPWWDLWRLSGWSPQWLTGLPVQVAGRIPVDWAGATERVEALIRIVLGRL
jgi:aminoglycoside phosphotransferase (APT) family kinase protein